MGNDDRQFPCIDDMQNKARQRMPRFLHDYLIGGLGEELNVERNRQALRDTLLVPRYLTDIDKPDHAQSLFGQKYDVPFGIAPLGLAGLLWPGCELAMARAAREHNVAHVLSTYSNEPLETIRPVVGDNGWFQFYPPNDPAMEFDLINRVRDAGYQVLVVTVDIPGTTRRERDIRNGMTAPPVFDLSTVLQVMTRPRWAMGTLRHGIPDFGNLSPYYPKGASLAQAADFLLQVMEGHISTKRFEAIRSAWKGKILVKGVLDPDEAEAYINLGADGVIVSNHGGRQFDAAPASAEVLPAIRQRLGPEATIVADSGIRSGLDILRMLALGADFVLIGRPFLYASAAIGAAGPAHAIKILKAELHACMVQMGASSVNRLGQFLYRRKGQPES